jgi:hypothetical protein
MTDPVSASASASGYLTDGEIIAWLQGKSDDQYGALRDMMNTSNDRANMISGLTQLKSDIDSGAAPDKILKEMQDLQDTYGATPYGPELKLMLGDMSTRLEAATTGADTQAQIDAINQQLADPNLDDASRAGLEGSLSELQVQLQGEQGTDPYKDEFSSKLQAEVDKLGRVDQLDLIKIQELMADGRQTQQLGSNIIASRDQASNAIVGNIRG